MTRSRPAMSRVAIAMTGAILTVAIMTLSGCSKPPAHYRPTVVDEIEQELARAYTSNNNVRIASEQAAKKTPSSNRSKVPDVVLTAMLPDLDGSLSPTTSQYEKRFNISVKDVPAQTFFAGLVKDTPYSLVVSPKVTGTISLNLKGVTVEQVLQTLERVYGYGYKRTEVGYEIRANQLETKIFNVDYLKMSRVGTSTMQINSGNLTSSSDVDQDKRKSSSVETSSSSDFWENLQTTLVAMLPTTEGRSVSMNPLAGIVVVKAYPRELDLIDSYLHRLRQNVGRQVILEAKILEVILNDTNQMGIDWQIFGARLNALADFPNPNLEIVDAFAGVIKWNAPNFISTIRALEQQGNVQVLSSPRISVLNNQKAIFKVGGDEFFVTDVSSTNNSTNVSTTQLTQDLELTPFFSGVSLDVTPQINEYGGVTLHVHPAVTQVKDQIKSITLGTAGGEFQLPLAQSTIRETDTVVHGRSGEVIVIGGLMKNNMEESIAQVPFLGSIPFVGALFRNTRQVSVKSELVILLRPQVIEQGSWQQELQDTQERTARLNKGFHFGTQNIRGH